MTDQDEVYREAVDELRMVHFFLTGNPSATDAELINGLREIFLPRIETVLGKHDANAERRAKIDSALNDEF